VDEVAAIVAERANSKGLRFTAHIAGDLPHRVMGDPTRLRQVLINLLTNAVKFTDQGSVELRVAPDGGRIFFSIRDTGIGMDERARARLFQPFGQADDSITRKYGGTGLGLMISQELVQAMGGHIEVDSAPGAGSCFWFALPLSEAAIDQGSAMAAPPASGTAETLPGLVGGRVLLVDDNLVNRKLGSAMLDRLGLPHDLAGNGVECLRRLAAGRYALVLMDMEMPEMDGLSATRQIRADEAAAGSWRLPIIAMTANAMHEDQQRCIDAGMDGYVAKPINLSLLEREIRRVAGSGDSQVPAMPAEDTAVFDLPRALAMVDDPELFAELASMFIKDLGGYLQETDDALSVGDWGRLSRGAHTLKGLFATFAAPRCEELARQLEGAAAAQDAAACAALEPNLRQEAEALLVALRAYIAAR